MLQGRATYLILTVAFVICGANSRVQAETKLIEGALATNLVPGDLEYAVLLPDGYREDGEPYPLIYFLHGGAQDRTLLSRIRPTIEGAWARGELPPAVIVMPSAGRSLYMDYKDGSERWETAITGPLLDHLRTTLNVQQSREGTVIGGVSMGGLGALRMAFKYPTNFAGVAVVEPAVMPAIAMDDVPRENSFFRPVPLLRSIYGRPLDAAYWQANNPVAIAVENSNAIRDSGLMIYFEVGDEDSLNLTEGVEFLHRNLYDQKIPHEYHLVRGADHLGRTMPLRMSEAFAFLGQVLDPPGPDPVVEQLRQQVAPLKRRAGVE